MSKELQKRLARIEGAARHSVGSIRIECEPTETNAEAVRRVFGAEGPPSGVPLVFLGRPLTCEEWVAEWVEQAAPQSPQLQQDRIARLTLFRAL